MVERYATHGVEGAVDAYLLSVSEVGVEGTPKKRCGDVSGYSGDANGHGRCVM